MQKPNIRLSTILQKGRKSRLDPVTYDVFVLQEGNAATNTSLIAFLIIIIGGVSINYSLTLRVVST
jgi:hypothetical protein